MDINEMKDVVLSTLGQAVDGAKGFTGKAAEGAKTVAGTVAEKARSGGSIVRLSMDAATARENLKKLYLEIGKLYYELHKNSPEEAFTQLFEEVRQAEELIVAKEAELSGHKDNIKKGFTAPSAASDAETEVDFDEVVAQAEAEAEAAAEPAAEQAPEQTPEQTPEQAPENTENQW